MSALRAVLLVFQIAGLVSIAESAAERGRWRRTELAVFGFISFCIGLALTASVVAS